MPQDHPITPSFDRVVSDNEPRAVFTGDTLFVGDVGPPDLRAALGCGIGAWDAARLPITSSDVSTWRGREESNCCSISRMLILIALFQGLMLAQEPVPASFIDANDIESTMRRSIANNVLDTKVKEAAVKGGIVRVGIVHRTGPETRALVHQELTEIYNIIEGSGTLLTGGTAQEPRLVSDPPNLGPTPSFYVTQVGGASQKVKPKDVIIVPAGTPHRFIQLDGPISYVIYRFEPTPAK